MSSEDDDSLGNSSSNDEQSNELKEEEEEGEKEEEETRSQVTFNTNITGANFLTPGGLNAFTVALPAKSERVACSHRWPCVTNICSYCLQQTITSSQVIIVHESRWLLRLL